MTGTRGKRSWNRSAEKVVAYLTEKGLI